MIRLSESRIEKNFDSPLFLIFDLIWRIKMNQNESIRSEPCLGGEKVTTKMVMRIDFWRFQAV